MGILNRNACPRMEMSFNGVRSGGLLGFLLAIISCPLVKWKRVRPVSRNNSPFIVLSVCSGVERRFSMHLGGIRRTIVASRDYYATSNGLYPTLDACPLRSLLHPVLHPSSTRKGKQLSPTAVILLE